MVRVKVRDRVEVTHCVKVGRLTSRHCIGVRVSMRGGHDTRRDG